MKLMQIKPYLEKQVILTDSNGKRYEGFLTNYVPELDDDNLIENVDLIPKDQQNTTKGYGFTFTLDQIKDIQAM
ncbi:hypothetical protein BpJC4_31020 [Weizmannia acidilactici]|uniref:hypothetical protein n=1 Tax=Weizmannia acidilactici TaxID=2607726 RepID=UPI00124C0A71|nr:hypothetical protein [Weizmannia acidilactici]GER68631.1 hypothetical protein BpJC4_31020 [Weizmannia acidilactici]